MFRLFGGRFCLLRRSLSCSAFADFENEDRTALADAIANLDEHFDDRAAFGRGHVERRLVAFERDERVFRRDRRTRLDVHLDDGNVLEVAEIGNANFLSAHPMRPRSATKRAHARRRARRIFSQEARRERTVDGAVIVGKTERQHQARLKRGAVPLRLHLRAHGAEDRDFRRVDDRRESRAADAAEARNRERTALNIRRRDLAFAHARRDAGQFLAQFQNAFAVDVAYDRHDEPVRRVDGNADVVIVLEDQRILGGRERRIDVRIFLQCRHRGFEQERDQRHAIAFCLGGFVQAPCDTLRDR